MMPLQQLAKFNERPGFDAHTANVVYKAMSEMDEDSALVFGRILVAEGLHYDLIAHGEEIIKAAEAAVAGRADALRRRFSRSAVAKARAGQDTSYEIRCLAELSKAFDPKAFSTEQRSQWARDQKRGEQGRFVTDHHQIHTDGGRPPMSQGAAEKITGAPKTNLSDADLAHYQQAYGQIRDMLAPYRNPALRAVLHLNVANRAGEERTEVLDVQNGQPSKVGDVLGHGDRIASAAVSVHPERDSSVGAGFDAVSALTGSPRAGAAAAGVATAASPDDLKAYNDKGTRYKGNEAYSGTTRTFNRVADASDLLQSSLGDVAPKKLQYALAVANHVGQFGPEAQKVIGPVADRTAYRYRGTERTVSRRLVGAMERLRRDPAVTSRSVSFRDAATGGIEREEGWDSGPVLNYFHEHLPNPDLNELQRKSGVIPPSEGIIITREGKVAHQSTGFADDWYLPFNLKHLTGLKGGEYIRTRSFGGPTTEDIYTGLMSGARSMTVVSHNGVYTVDFDRNLRGGRRFNDKAARMVGRYGNLLDAVRQGKVSTGGNISRSRMNELREKALGVEPDETSSQHKELVRRLEADERNNPKLSQVERDKAADEWVSTLAEKKTTRDGRTMRGDQLVGEELDRRAKQRFLAGKEAAARFGGPPLESLSETREKIGAEYGAIPTREGQVAFLAEQMSTKHVDDFAAFMQRTETANRDRLHPLALNGRGYHSALMALQEQFPYYIADVRYHEWSPEVGRGEADTYENRKDTGYVLPKHNRPAEALAGHFDARVNGTGKVRADSIRFQNRRAEPELAPLETAKVTPGVEPFSGGVGGGGVGPAAPGSQRAADLAVARELRAQTHFAPTAKLKDSAGDDIEMFEDGKGLNIAEEIAAHPDEFPDPAIKEFFSRTLGELEAMPESELHALTQKIVGPGRPGEKAFAVNSRTVHVFQNGGKAAAGKERPEAADAKLRELNVDHAFPGEGPVYDVTRDAPPPAQIQGEYTNHPGLKELTRTYALPPLDADDKEFAAHVDRIRGALIDRGLEIKRRRSQGAGSMATESARLDLDADALLRATHLKRRYKQAVIAHPVQMPDVQNQVAFINEANLEQMLRNIRTDHSELES